MMRRFSYMLLVASSGIAACSSPEPQACTPPRDYWRKPHNWVGLYPVNNTLSLTHDGSIYWNGAKVSLKTVDLYLQQMHTLSPEPELFLEVDAGSPCRALEDLRNRAEKTLECNKEWSVCAEGLRSVWDRLPLPPGSKVS